MGEVGDMEGFDEWLNGYQLSETTKSLYKQIVKQMLKEIGEFTEENVRKWLVSKPFYNYRSAVKTYLEYKGLNWRLPKIKQKRKHTPKVVERPLLRDTIEKLKVDKDLYYIYRVLYETGARISEVLNLKYMDIDFENAEIEFVRTKSGYPRKVKISKKLAEELEQYLKYEKGVLGNEKCFLTRCKDRKSAYVYLQERLKILENRKVIIPRERKILMKTHNFRRALINEAIRLTGDIVAVKAFIGHRHLESTQQYVSEKTELMRKAKVEEVLGYREGV